MFINFAGDLPITPEILSYLSALILGLFAGTQITEGALMVPQWKALSAKDFYEYHEIFGPKIHQFFKPLTIAATLFPVINAIYYTTMQVNGFELTLITAALSITVLAMFFLYFKKANQQFANQSLSDEALRLELIRWGRWHWARVILEMLAFLTALLTVTLLGF